MRIGIASDTHGRVDTTQAASNLFEAFSIDQLIHCGDIGSTEVVKILTKWPSHWVFGNVDSDRETLSADIVAHGGLCYGDQAEFKLEGFRIGVTHGHLTTVLNELEDSSEFDVLCSGHTHRAFNEKRDSMVRLNPGALHRAAKHTVAILELPSLDCEIVPV